MVPSNVKLTIQSIRGLSKRQIYYAPIYSRSAIIFFIKHRVTGYFDTLFYCSILIFYLHSGLVIVTMLPDSLGRFGFNVKGGCDQVSITATCSYMKCWGSGSAGSACFWPPGSGYGSSSQRSFPFLIKVLSGLK